jgi:hypothetical protein
MSMDEAVLSLVMGRFAFGERLADSDLLIAIIRGGGWSKLVAELIYRE